MREALSQLPEPGCRASRRRAASTRRRGGWCSSSTTLPEREPDEWVKGPPEHLRERRLPRALPASRASPWTSSRCATDFSASRSSGARWRRLFPSGSTSSSQGLAFAKSMVWDDERGSLCAPGPLAAARSSTTDDSSTGFRGSSFGHRFTRGEIEIPHAGDYLERAARGRCRARPGRSGDADHRRASTRSATGASRTNASRGGRLSRREPRRARGDFDERFLQLPERVIVTAMQSHQRYFPLGGNRFAFVANGGDPETVLAGNENVLEGRLEDAAFTFERDVARGIEGLLKELGSITFVAGRGLVRGEGRAARSSSSKRSAAARPRARRRGSPRPTRRRSSCASSRTSRATSAPSTRASPAIPRPSAPRSTSSTCPRARAGRCPRPRPAASSSAADKVDNLTVAFALGQKPTGSRDPYGLRRAAIGLCRLALEANLGLDVRGLVAPRHWLLVAQGADVKEDPSEVADFVEERLEGLLDVPVEFVRAARLGGVAELGAIARLAQTLAARGPVGGVRARLRGVRPREPARRKGRRRGGRARRAARDRRSRDRAHRGARRRLAEDRGGAPGPRLRRGAGRGRGARPPDRPLLRRGARDGRGPAGAREPPAAPARRPRRRRARSAISRRSRDDAPLEIHVISDSTGETAARFAEAVERQFPDEEFEIVRHPRITSVDDVQLAAARARGRRSR